MKNLIILGAGDFARDVAWWVIETFDPFLDSLDRAFFLRFVDDTVESTDVLRLFGREYPIIRDWKLPEGFDSYVIGVSDPRTKLEFASRCAKITINPHKTIVHESAVVAPDAQIGHGGVIGPNCRVGLNVELGSFVTIGPGCIIGHDTIIRDYVTLMPGSIVSGNCHLDTGVVVGAGAVIKEKISIAPWNRIGIQAAVVHNHTETDKILAGVPAYQTKT